MPAPAFRRARSSTDDSSIIHDSLASTPTTGMPFDYHDTGDYAPAPHGGFGAMGVSSQGFLNVGSYGLGLRDSGFGSQEPYRDMPAYQVSDLSPSGLHSLLTEEDLQLFNSLTSHPESYWCTAPPDIDCTNLDHVAADLAPLTRNRPPKQLSQYLLGPVLGEGTYGKVREGYHTETLERVALKVMKRKHLRRVKGAFGHVETEILVMRQLARQGDHIQSLREVIRTERLVAIVMDCALTSLQHLIDCQYHRRLPERAAGLVFQQLLSGIAHVHSKSIVHKDIKPSNVMIMPDGVVKLADFGVAEVISMYSPSARCERTHGSPAFQCPQIAAAKDSFDGFKSDVWSAGVTLYAVLTGRLPFSGRTLYHLYANIANDAPALDDLPPAVAELLLGMLEKDEEARWTVDECLHWPWVAGAGFGPYRMDEECVVWCPESYPYVKALSPSHNDAPTGLLSPPSGSGDDLGARSSSDPEPGGPTSRSGSLCFSDSRSASPIIRSRFTPDHPTSVMLCPPGTSLGSACSSVSTAADTFLWAAPTGPHTNGGGIGAPLPWLAGLMANPADCGGPDDDRMRLQVTGGGCMHYSREALMQNAQWAPGQLCIVQCPAAILRRRAQSLCYVGNAVHHLSPLTEGKAPEVFHTPPEAEAEKEGDSASPEEATGCRVM